MNSKIFFPNRKKRKEILEEYETHLEQLKNTGCFLDHWIDGSFITSKKNPNDIDTLTEFDGKKADELNKKEIINELILNSKSHTNGYCHSLRVYQYPASDKEQFRYYHNTKMRILFGLFGSDRNNIPKGFVHLMEV